MIEVSEDNVNFKPMPQEFLRVRRLSTFISRKDIGSVTTVPISDDSLCECCDFNKVFIILALADLSDSSPIKNDFWSMLYELPLEEGTLVFTLQKHNGVNWSNVATLDSTYGTNYPAGIFTDNPNFAGFKLQWNAVLDAHGTGNYRIRVTGTGLDGDANTDYSPLFCLKEYSQFSSDRTVRIQWNNNGYISNSDDDFQLINFGNTNWSQMIRLSADFGFAADEETTVELSQYSGDALRVDRIRHLKVPKYIFRSGRYPDWIHSMLKNYAFVSNSLNFTTYSRLDKHTYTNKEVVKEPNGYNPNYDQVYNKWYKVEVSFKDKFDDTGFRKNCQPSGVNCEPVTIIDSDGNFVEYAPSGSTWVCNVGDIVNTLSCAQLNDSTNGLTFAQRQLIQVVNPLKTGITTSGGTGDDGDLEHGRLVNFTTLDCNNPFGNTNRHTDQSGGQTYSDAIVVDWATGLMLYRTVQGATDWDSARVAANGSTQGGYTDWALPNLRELHSICDFSLINSMNYGAIMISSSLWTGSVTAASSSNAWFFGTAGDYGSASKAALIPYIIVRKFTLADLGL